MAEKQNLPKKLMQHKPVVALIVVVAVIFVLFLFFFQVDENEVAIVKRFGKPILERDTSPGLCRRLPYPIEEVWTHDTRLFVFPKMGDSKNPTRGEYEEILTADKINIIVTVYLTWSIPHDTADANYKDEIVKYMEEVENREAAEDKLNSIVRGAKTAVFGRHKFSELINDDPSKIRMDAIEAELAEAIRAEARENFSIYVKDVGISYLGLPDNITQKVFERMRAERKRETDRIIAEGKAEAEKLRAEADRQKQRIISEAKGEATQIRAKGDKLATQSYDAFKENPELEIFLRQLAALEKISKKKTYLLLDTTTPPLNLMTLETLENLKMNRLKVDKLETMAPKPVERKQ